MSLPALTPDDVARLYAACGTNTWEGERDALLVTLAFNTGLRPAEMARLHVRDISADGRWLMLHRGLRHHAIVPLNQRAARALHAWIQRNNLKANDPLFIRTPNTRKRLHAREIANLMAQISARAGVPFDAENARATLARVLFNLSEDAAVIRSVLPPEEQEAATLPLEHLPPFSLVLSRSEMLFASLGMLPLPMAFMPPEDDPVLERSRALLERAGEVL